jgi:hypothetical protein
MIMQNTSRCVSMVKTIFFGFPFPLSSGLVDGDATWTDVVSLGDGGEKTFQKKKGTGSHKLDLLGTPRLNEKISGRNAATGRRGRQD